MAAFTFAEVGRHLDNWFEWLAAYLTPRPNSIHAMNSTGWAQLTQVVYSEVVLPEEYNSLTEAFPWMTAAATRGGASRSDVLAGKVTGHDFMAAIGRGLQ